MSTKKQETEKKLSMPGRLTAQLLTKVGFGTGLMTAAIFLVAGPKKPPLAGE